MRPWLAMLRSLPPRYLAIGGLALVVAAAAVCRGPGPAATGQPAGPVAQTAAAPAAEPPPEVAASGSAPAPPAAPPTLGRDLFEPAGPAAGEAGDEGELVLSATIIGADAAGGRGARVAMINNRPVAEGETILGARVVRIEEGGVTLDVGGYNLRLDVCPPAED